jgi:RimJ/RimL family protein N-acetyltransferase
MNEPAVNPARGTAARQRLRIRSARVEDAAALCAAERETAAVPGRLVSNPDELREDAFAQTIARLAQGAGCYLVAERDGALAGHAMLEPIAPLAALAHVRQLTIVVHPGHTGQGVGAALMTALVYWAGGAGVEKIELRVRAGNDAALALYRKFGFVEEGRLRGRIRLPDGNTVDDICMARLIVPERRP